MHSNQKTPRLSKRSRDSQPSSPAPCSSRLSRFLPTPIPTPRFAAALSILSSVLASQRKLVNPLLLPSKNRTPTAQHPFRSQPLTDRKEAPRPLAQDTSTATTLFF